MHQSDVYGAIGALSLASEETQPLVAAAIRFAPLGAVVPAGWMRQQLEARGGGLQATSTQQVETTQLGVPGLMATRWVDVVDSWQRRIPIGLTE